MSVVSLFDGISCGRVALERAGIAVSSYSAFETDKYARSVSRYNYPDIQQCGDVFDADFSLFTGHDLVMGGSPCTFWSGSKANREVDKSGVGWKLFMRFAEAVRIIRPRLFLYENVASMPPNIKVYISEELGVEPILINSALVSAQNRNRLYWTNIKGITQPEDKGILLRDILETGITAREKALCIDACYHKGGNHSRPLSQSGMRSMVYEPVAPDKKSAELLTGYNETERFKYIYSVRNKSVWLTANGIVRGGESGLYTADLPDGDYIIRTLSNTETERCQTLPDNYTSLGVDDNGKTVNISIRQRHKCVGNGWTIDVITHILRFADE